APEKISVTVLNGSGVKGAASDLAAELTADGFNVIGVGNADRMYSQTTVLHDPAYDESGRTLGAAIPGSLVQEDISLGTTLTVVVGTDSPTVVPVEVSGSTSSPEPTESLVTRPADQSICSSPARADEQGLASAPAGNVARRERRCAGWMA